MIKKIAAPILTLFLAAGCANTGLTERIDELERQLGQVQATATEAASLAREAKSDAAGMGSSVSDAERMAREAMSMAEAANERATRMADECCVRK